MIGQKTGGVARGLLMAALATVWVTAVGCGGGSPEDKIKALADEATKLADGVKTEADAKAALPKLKELMGKMDKAGEEWANSLKAEAKTPEAAMGMLGKMLALAPTMEKCKQAVTRVEELAAGKKPDADKPADATKK